MYLRNNALKDQPAYLRTVSFDNVRQPVNPTSLITTAASIPGQLDGGPPASQKFMLNIMMPSTGG